MITTGLVRGWLGIARRRGARECRCGGRSLTGNGEGLRPEAGSHEMGDRAEVCLVWLAVFSRGCRLGRDAAVETHSR